MSIASFIKAQWLSFGFFQQPPLMKKTKKIIVFVNVGKQRIFREMSGLVFRNKRGQSHLSRSSFQGDEPYFCLFSKVYSVRAPQDVHEQLKALIG
ncbi:conserved hypothetical protein [Ricinus communis]|uniref:Uncharacterized protein n=1 Tax=Ricinus communis TaxID=3988 RepID=B9T3H9_RICCO|nr:conserved hypothetical protein [Ricinus communis]